MTLSGMVACLMLCAIALFTWWLLFVWIPAAMTSIFRHRLWRIRDTVMDEVLSGTLPKTPMVMHVVRSTELMIVAAEDVTMWRLLWSPNPPDWMRDEYRLFSKKGLGELDGDCQKRLMGYKKSAQRAFDLHIRWGSPSGWLFNLLYGMLSLLIELLEALTKKQRFNDDPDGLRHRSDEFVRTRVVWALREAHVKPKNELTACVS